MVAPGTAPGGAQEAATPVEALAAEMQAESDRYRAASVAEPWNPGQPSDVERGQRAIAVHLGKWAGRVRDLAPAWDALREQLRQAEATARLYRECEAELQEIHDSLVAAYGRDDLSEDTPAVVAAVIAERDAAREELAELTLIHRARGDLLRDAVSERDRQARYAANGYVETDLLRQQRDAYRELLNEAGIADTTPAEWPPEWEQAATSSLSERDRYRAALERVAAATAEGSHGDCGKIARAALEATP